MFPAFCGPRQAICVLSEPRQRARKKSTAPGLGTGKCIGGKVGLLPLTRKIGAYARCPLDFRDSNGQRTNELIGVTDPLKVAAFNVASIFQTACVG
jgi:hypothetical protein